MADAGGFDADEDIVRADVRNGNLLELERFADFDKTDGFHARATLRTEQGMVNGRFDVDRLGGTCPH